MTELHRLGRSTLTDRAAESLIAYIEAADRQPGDLLPSEASLAAQLGVSRPVVREALRTLEGRGLVQIVNGRGAVIQGLDVAPLRSYFQRAIRVDPAGSAILMEARAGIEIQSARLAARRRSQDDIEQLRAALDAARRHMGDIDAFTDFDLAFHVAVARASGNALIGFLVGSMRDALRETIQAGLRRHGPGRVEPVLTRHMPILAAVEAGDAEAAGRAMERHFVEAAESFQRGHSG